MKGDNLYDAKLRPVRLPLPPLKAARARARARWAKALNDYVSACVAGLSIGTDKGPEEAALLELRLASEAAVRLEREALRRPLCNP